MLIHHLSLHSPQVVHTAQQSVVAIGNFDGVHLGHAYLVSRAKELASRMSLPLGVITFDPHPRSFFARMQEKPAPPFLLTDAKEKARQLEKLDVAHLFQITFDQDLAACSAEDFINKILIKMLNVNHVVTGLDFHFGKGRAGTISDLAKNNAFGATAIDALRDDQGEIFSSGRVRIALATADFNHAKTLLGRPWTFSAEVTHGDKRGRELGYPTANLHPDIYQPLPFGVYAVRAKIEGSDTWRAGAANFGIRPMFETPRPLFEVHLLDAPLEILGEFYGKIMYVEPIRFLRPEAHFPDIESLKNQMHKDCLNARSVLKSTAL